METFDSDVEGVVHRAKFVCRSAAVNSFLWIRHIVDLQSFVELQEGCAACWENTAIFGPWDLRGGTKEKRWKERQ